MQTEDKVPRGLNNLHLYARQLPDDGGGWFLFLVYFWPPFASCSFNNSQMRLSVVSELYERSRVPPTKCTRLAPRHHPRESSEILISREKTNENIKLLSYAVNMIFTITCLLRQFRQFYNHLPTLHSTFSFCRDNF